MKNHNNTKATQPKKQRPKKRQNGVSIRVCEQYLTAEKAVNDAQANYREAVESDERVQKTLEQIKKLQSRLEKQMSKNSAIVSAENELSNAQTVMKKTRDLFLTERKKISEGQDILSRSASQYLVYTDTPVPISYTQYRSMRFALKDIPEHLRDKQYLILQSLITKKDTPEVSKLIEKLING